MTVVDATHESATWRAALVVTFTDIFTQAAPAFAPAVALDVQVPVLDRNDRPVIDAGGVPVKHYVPTGFAPCWTPSRRLVFPGLDGRVQSGVVMLPYPRFRLTVAAGALAARPSQLEFDLPLPSGALLDHRVDLLPGPDYLFPAHVPVVRGRVVPNAPGAPRVFEVGVPLPVAPTEFDRAQFGLTDDEGRFSVGLRSVRSTVPFDLVVRDAQTGAQLAVQAVNDIVLSNDIPV